MYGSATARVPRKTKTKNLGEIMVKASCPVDMQRRLDIVRQAFLSPYILALWWTIQKL